MESQNNFSLSSLKNQRIDFRQEIRRYIALLLIPLFFCIMLYFSVQKISYNQYRLSAERTAEQFQLQISSMMHEVNLVSDSLISDFIALENDQKENISSSLLYTYSDPPSICRQLSIRRENSSYIEHIYLIPLQQPYIYSDSGYYNMVSLESILRGMGTDQNSLFEVEEKKWNMLSEGHLSNPYCLSPFRDSSGNILGYLLITLDLNAFMEVIFNINAEFACLYNDTTFLPSLPLERVYSAQELGSETIVSRLLKKPVKCFQLQVDDYTYMIAISKSSYYLPFFIISLCFVLYAVLVFAFSFFYLYRVSKNRYLQLSRLIDALPQESATVSYKNLIPAVQTALLNYRDQNKLHQETLNDHLLHGILHAQYKDHLLTRGLQQLQIPTENARYHVAIFYLKSYDNVALLTSDEDDVFHMTWVIFQTAVKQFTDDSFRSVSCTEPERFVTLFYTLSSECPDRHVMAACESICKFLSDGYGIHLHTAISGTVTAPEDLAFAFAQAQNLERFAVAVDDQSKIISESLLHENGGLILKGDFFRQTQTLINTLLIGKYDLIPSMVASLLQEHVSPLTADYELSTQRLYTVSHILREFLLTVNQPGFDAQTSCEQLSAAGSISELTAAAEEIFTRLSQSASQKKTSFREVDEACRFIQENLSDQNLNVSMICEAVGLIVQRLTPMFQEQLNMGIAEYVNFRRIEEAKTLLADTKLTVKQIAAKIGYSTTDTLTRNFRKLENMTPTEYRKVVL